jgi:hypothetical protein
MRTTNWKSRRWRDGEEWRQVEGGSMNMATLLKTMAVILSMGMSMNANAGLFGFGDMTWKEEVLLHDGSKIIVKRSQSYGGRREIGQDGPIKEHVLTFQLPGSGKSLKWVSEFSQDVGRANFQLLALHILGNTPYVVATPNGCLAYNKWGRPNPPYVVFRYEGAEWQRIALSELPPEFKTFNVIINNGREEYIERAADKLGYVPVNEVQAINRSLRQAELQTILREPVKPGSEASSVNCEELIKYKGYWIMPNDPVARRIVDRETKNKTVSP